MRILYDRHTAVCLSVPVALPADGDGIAGDSLSAISSRHYHHQRDVVASRDVGVSPAIMLNPERGDYETLVVSRSVLSGSTKLKLNPERGDYETLVVSRSVLSGSTKLMLNA